MQMDQQGVYIKI